MAQIELKPCPFCRSKDAVTRLGIEPTKTKSAFVRCPSCNTLGPEYRGDESSEDVRNKAAELWNARPALDYIPGPPSQECDTAFLARDGYFAAYGERIHNHDEASWAIAGGYISDEEIVAHYPLDALLNAGER